MKTFVIGSLLAYVSFAKVEVKKPIFSQWTQDEKVHDTKKDPLIVGY